jgi:apoptosis-inducing factor 2
LFIARLFAIILASTYNKSFLLSLNAFFASTHHCTFLLSLFPHSSSDQSHQSHSNNNKNKTNKMAQTVVILGASFAGLKIAHHLLKNTLPVVKDLKVIIVSPTTHVYFNLAAPRAIIPGQIPDEKLVAAYEPAFSKYPSSSYEIVLGKATSVDPANKKVEVETESGVQTVAYNVLVVTTGSNTGAMPWKASGSYKQLLDTLHSTQEKVKKAKSIVVGGGGVTGVETAGELGFEYGKTKDITLVSHVINS